MRQHGYSWIGISCAVLALTIAGCDSFFLSKNDKKRIEREMMTNAQNVPISPRSIGLPVYPNGEDFWEITSNVGHDEKSKPKRKMLHAFTYNIQDALPKDVFDFYVKELPLKGWGITSRYYKGKTGAKNTHWTLIAKKYLKDAKKYQLMRIGDGFLVENRMNNLQLELYELE
jgi:hypothetical protein